MADGGMTRSSISRPKATWIAPSSMPRPSFGPTSWVPSACWMRRGKRGARAIVQVSTDEVYGTLGADIRPSPSRRRWHPTVPMPPARPAPIFWSAPTHHTFGMNAVITRCSNNYGPYQFPEKLIPLFIANALAESASGLRRRHAGARLDSRQDHCRGIDAASDGVPAKSTTSAAAASGTTST